jgi:hypothetical protein
MAHCTGRVDFFARRHFLYQPVHFKAGFEMPTICRQLLRKFN